MSDTTIITERDAKTGRFLTGNNGGGRPKGSRNKLCEQFISDVRDAWERHGAAALERVATEEPGTLLKVVAGLIPKDISLSVGLDAASFAQSFETALQVLGVEQQPRHRPKLPGQKVIDHVPVRR